MVGVDVRKPAVGVARSDRAAFPALLHPGCCFDYRVGSNAGARLRVGFLSAVFFRHRRGLLNGGRHRTNPQAQEAEAAQHPKPASMPPEGP